MNASVAPVDLSVVVPVYDERGRLPSTLAALRAHLDAGPYRWELIVVDDGSADGGAAVVARVADGDPRVRLLRTPSNRGKGHAVRTGVAASRGRLVLFTDADLATPLDELPCLHAALVDGAAAAIASRAGGGRDVRRHLPRRLLARTGAAVIRAVVLRGVADTQCGFKLFDGARARAAFAVARVDGWGFDVEILCLFARRGWPVTEVPVRWTDQPGSKVRASGYVRTLGDVVAIRLRFGRCRIIGPARPMNGTETARPRTRPRAAA
ncbi:glycosyltransferase [Actinomadura sp. KC06]|uniref:glycosyltransferase n=1 Tax=Actinomadura sp. KC06 TaxID=2530369 RepID=UPI0010470AD2|nr:glycosyltransferase [Actinomadura sp. KC06]TDD25230.1 glycosyltransferase [Actinomadura sp. KC06]